MNSVEIKQIIKIVEKFISDRRLVCYGGTAINNILPHFDQFYNKSTEIPDYDFFSTDAMNDAKLLADIYSNNGFVNIEAKAGIHHGTYKVFVNYIPVADITYLHPEIFNSFKHKTIQVGGIHYAPPNFLRMSMYLELSRPDGDISRWEKVVKRLSVLNKHFPLTKLDCTKIDFQRPLQEKHNKPLGQNVFDTIKDAFIDQSAMFFGAYALSEYSKYMPHNSRKKIKKFADFDVISIDPKQTADFVVDKLTGINIKNGKVVKHESVGETIPVHYEIKIGKDTVAYVYKPFACHSYNLIDVGKYKVKIATIDTILSFFLAFLYTNRKYYTSFENRIMCIANFLFDVQQKNRLEQKGILRRFSINCYGHQQTLTEIRNEKSLKFEELKKNKNDQTEFDEWFLNYKPSPPTKKDLKSPTTKKKKKTKKKVFNPYNQTRKKKWF